MSTETTIATIVAKAVADGWVHDEQSLQLTDRFRKDCAGLLALGASDFRVKIFTAHLLGSSPGCDESPQRFLEVFVPAFLSRGEVRAAAISASIGVVNDTTLVVGLTALAQYERLVAERQRREARQQ